MKEIVAVQDMLKDWDTWQVIDVRSPGEFLNGHIPGAISIPLFTDEERARVGTLYKQTSPESAFMEGIRIAGVKMPSFVDAAKSYQSLTTKHLLIHCWRGGKRSQAMHWLFNFSGIEASRLEGGYKQYRCALQSFFAETKFDLRIIGGCTGAGKTEILHALAHRGAQIIDLEQLAHHKGSAFGSIGEKEQPTTEQFENDLFAAFLSLDLLKPIWLENESKSIGRVNLPETLWTQMRNAVLMTIDVDEEIRLNRALTYYSDVVHTDILKAAFEKIKKRLGGLEFQSALTALDAKDLRTAAAIALKYYDKSYTYQLSQWPSERVIHLRDCNEVEKTADRLLKMEQLNL
jgi:tRNA 2-selenouridine synthase